MNPIRVTLIDPREDEPRSDSLVLEIDPAGFIEEYYGFTRLLLERASNDVMRVELAGATYVVARLPETNIRFGLREEICEAMFGSREFYGRKHLWEIIELDYKRFYQEGGASDPERVSIGMDGHVLIIGSYEP